MLQQIKNLISYLLLFVCILLLSVFYRQPFFVFATLLLLFFPFLSYYGTHYAFQALSISLTTAPKEGPSNSQFPLCITLNNPTFFPFLRVELTLEITSFFRPNNEKEILILPALCKNKNNYFFPVSYEKIGCYQIRCVNCKVFDYLHFFSFQKECTAQVEVHILPSEQMEISLDESCYSEGFDEFEDMSGKGFTNADLNNVREYIPGDRLQKIHWKLSGKLQKLMVKESSQGAMHCFIVLAELFLQPSADAPDTLDPAIETAHAVCKELYKLQEPFFFSLYSILREDFLLFRIETKEDLEQAFVQILYEKPYQEKDLAYTYFKNSEIMKGTVIHVTHEGIADYEME